MSMTNRICPWAVSGTARWSIGQWPHSSTALRFGDVVAVGLDETLAVRRGSYRRQEWSIQIVDVKDGQLLDVLDGKDVNTLLRLVRRAVAGVA